MAISSAGGIRPRNFSSAAVRCIDQDAHLAPSVDLPGIRIPFCHMEPVWESPPPATSGPGILPTPPFSMPARPLDPVFFALALTLIFVWALGLVYP